jgi:hypothetical protein
MAMGMSWMGQRHTGARAREVNLKGRGARGGGNGGDGGIEIGIGGEWDINSI